VGGFVSQANRFFIVPPLISSFDCVVASLHPDNWNGGDLFPQEFAGKRGNKLAWDWFTYEGAGTCREI
jgi:hypothetical protein